MAYTTDEKVEPFWAEASSVAGGRDPLAIQNSSVVIYTKMVVGITNVTNRIRYFGFFCWIFDTILKNTKKTNSLQEQIRYSRRAELLLAYLMVNNFPEVTGVSGSTYARKNTGSTINLIKGADWESKTEGGSGLYWKLRLGIFGQYYKGVMRELNLINHPSPQHDLNIYTLTEKGSELVDAFIENVPEFEQDLFWKSVYKGNIEEQDLYKLKSFALHIIFNQSNEKTFYENILLTADNRKAEPTFNRRETIKLILKHLNLQENGIENPVRSFLSANYLANIKEQELKKDASTAWYLFEINEIIHVAYEHFHSCFQYFIEEYPTNLEKNIEKLVNETFEVFKEEYPSTIINSISQLSKHLSLKENNLYDHYKKMEKTFHSKEYDKCLMYAVKTILNVYNDVNKHIDQLDEFASAPEYNFNRIGYTVDLINELVILLWELNIKDYVKSILLKAINLHTFSSYSKTKIGQSLVHNYMIEDHSVWRLRETFPSRTTPRLQNVLQYIIDLAWVKKEGKVYSITDIGNKKIGLI